MYQNKRQVRLGHCEKAILSNRLRTSCYLKAIQDLLSGGPVVGGPIVSEPVDVLPIRQVRLLPTISRRFSVVQQLKPEKYLLVLQDYMFGSQITKKQHRLVTCFTDILASKGSAYNTVRSNSRFETLMSKKYLSQLLSSNILLSANHIMEIKFGNRGNYLNVMFASFNRLVQDPIGPFMA